MNMLFRDLGFNGSLRVVAREWRGVSHAYYPPSAGLGECFAAMSRPDPARSRSRQDGRMLRFGDLIERGAVSTEINVSMSGRVPQTGRAADVHVETSPTPCALMSR